MCIIEAIGKSRKEEEFLRRQFAQFSDTITHTPLYEEELRLRHETTSIWLGSYGGVGSTQIVNRTNLDKEFVNAGKNQIRDFLLGSASAIRPNYFHIGSGTTAWASGDTGLGQDITAGSFIVVTSGFGTFSGFFTGSLTNDVGGVIAITSGIEIPFGTGSYGSVASTPSLEIGSNLTLECWINPNSTNNGVMFAKWAGGTNNRSYQFRHTAANELAFVIGSPGGNGPQLELASSSTIGTGWHHVAGQYRPGSYMRVYIDGSIAGSTVSSIYNDIATGNTMLMITGEGAGTRSTNYLGSIDMIRISNNLRYDANFVPPSGQFTSDANTAALYYLNTTANGLVDSSSNSNNGSFIGTVNLVQGSTYSVTPREGPGQTITVSEIGLFGNSNIYIRDYLGSGFSFPAGSALVNTRMGFRVGS